MDSSWKKFPLLKYLLCVRLLPLETGADSNVIGKNEKSESFHFILVQHYAFDYDVKRNSIHADALTAQNFLSLCRRPAASLLHLGAFPSVLGFGKCVFFLSLGRVM